MKRILILLAICILLVSCSQTDQVDLARVGLESINGVRECDEQLVGGLSQKEKEMIYSVLFSRIYHDFSRRPGTDVPLRGDMVYRVTTASDIDTGILERDKLARPDVLASFRAENKKPERLPLEQITIWPVFPYDETSDAKQLYYSAKSSRQRPTEAAVVFSNIGFDPKRRECLVYVEYFNGEIGMIKTWIQFFVFRRSRQAESDDRFSGLESIWRLTWEHTK